MRNTEIIPRPSTPQTYFCLARKSMGKAFAFSAIFLVFSLLSPGRWVERAEACRDCPFPMLVSPQHWRMPGGYSDVVVEETNLGHRQVLTVVRLIDARTSELLAIGQLHHTKGLRQIRVALRDITGGQLEANITYENESRDRVRIKITCRQCSLQSAYLQ